MNESSEPLGWRDVASARRSQGERVGLSGQGQPLRREPLEQSVPERFERVVAQHAQRLAIKDGDQALTYSALNRAANRLAHAILAERGEGEEPVALVLEHGLRGVVAILAVLKAGKAYVPLNAADPPARMEYVLRDSQARLVVCSSRTMPVVRELIPDGVGLINIDQTDGNLTEEDPCLSLTPDSMGAILYTSGSTGQPKGVVLAHLNLLGGAMSSGASSSICPDDRITLLASYAFGGSLFSVFGSLLNAAAVLPFDVRRQGIDALPDWLAREEITIYYSVPTVFRNLGVPSAGKGRFPTIRLVCLGGETILRRDLDLYKQYFPDDCLLRLGMGMTEAGGVARIFLNKESEVEGSVMPAGYPVAGVEVLLLDEEGNEVPCGEVGEIVVKSPYLARGYWRKPELTKARFRSDPQGSDLRVYYTGDLGHRAPDGCLYHRGRADFQVKVRGHRVELSEVETALLEIPQVKEGAVRAIEQDDGTSALAAYVVPQGNPAPTVTDLRAELTARLPNHMMPSAFVLMDAMPRTATGKVDRLALPEPDGSRPPLAAAFVAPRTPIEEAVADVWSRLLGVAPIGVLDSFFDLGGHSLLATQMISRLRDQFDVELPLADFFASPTAERVALAVTQALLEKAGPQDAAELLGDLRQ